MFKYLIRFEAFYQLRQRAFIWLSLLFLGFGFLMGMQGATRGNLLFNSAYAIAHTVSLFTLGSVFIIMFFAISGTLRDKQYNMGSIIYSSPIKKYQFFVNRFLGVFLSSVITFSMFLLGFLISTFMPGIDPERTGAFNLMHYFSVLGFIIIPNILICTALIFSVSILTKNTIATYVSAVFIYTLYFICSIFLNSPLMAQAVPASPEGMALAAMFDPFGISAFFEQTQFWTPYQKDTQMIAFSGYYMWNRILWIFIALGVLLVTYKYFSFRTTDRKPQNKKSKERISLPSLSYQPIQPSLTKKSQRQAFISLLKIDLKGVFKSLPFIAILLCWIIIVVSEIYSRIRQGGAYNDSLYPMTNLLIELITQPMTFLSIILIVFYGGELFWRERINDFNIILDATPTSNLTFYWSKFVTLVSLPLLLILTGIMVCISLQAALGHYNFEIEQYLFMLYYHGVPMIVYSAMTLFIHTMVKNKYVGMTITGLIIIVLGSSASIYLGIEHPLLRFGALPKPEYTNMNGYSAGTKLFNHLAVYWSAFACILIFLSSKLWKRGIIISLSHRWQLMRSNWKKRNTITVLFFLVTFLSLGSVIFYNKNLVTSYLTIDDYLDQSEAYERLYKKYDTLPQLYPLAIKTTMDLYPIKAQFNAKADYILQNKGDNKAELIFVTEKEPLASIKFDNAELVTRDTVLGTYLFKLSKPLNPNDSIQMHYEITKKQKGYEISNSLVDNGTYIMHKNFSPVIGYRNSLEIEDTYERQKRGLPKRDEVIENDEHILNGATGFGKITNETVISTDIDQTAIGTGNLIRKWSENNRNYFEYRSNGNIIPTMGYFSARYDVIAENYRGIQLEQYYHPEHRYNIDTIQRAMRHGLDYCVVNYGNYAFDHLRIAEVPSHWNMGGYAHSGTISMVEDRLYLTDLRNKNHFNLVAKRTIHEVSHQWWGHMLTPKIVPGGALLIEGLAKYTEAMVMEKVYGKKALWELGENANKRYFSGRSFAKGVESPLYKVDEESFLSYGKAYTVMLALKELIGEEQVNAALKKMVDRHKDEIELKATSIEFINELYKVAPKEYHSLIDDWFKRVITYDLKLDDVQINRLTDGTFEVKLKVLSKRYKTLAEGREIEIGIDEPIQIGIFSKHPGELTSENDVIYLENKHITGNKTTIRIVVDAKPEFVAIDPFGTRSDANRIDNIK